MKKATAVASAGAYVSALDGWRRKCVEALRARVRAAAPLEEAIN
jgi:hypothetical protein